MVDSAVRYIKPAVCGSWSATSLRRPPRIDDRAYLAGIVDQLCTGTPGGCSTGERPRETVAVVGGAWRWGR